MRFLSVDHFGKLTMINALTKVRQPRCEHFLDGGDEKSENIESLGITNSSRDGIQSRYSKPAFLLLGSMRHGTVATLYTEALKKENQRLKKIVSDLELDKLILKEIGFF
jgi:hypothetical protein